MKTFLLSILIGTSGYFITAQPAFQFTYDASGNRVKRELIDLTDLPPDEPEYLVTHPNNPSEMEQSREAEEKSILGSDEGQLIHVYPNPTADLVFIEIPRLSKDSEGYYQVTSSSGKVIQSSQSLDSRIQLDLSQQSAGHYVLQMRYGEVLKEWIIIKD